MDQTIYKDILDAMGDGVYLVNRKRRILYWNKAAEKLSGYSAEEVLGKSCVENTLHHVDDEGTHLCLKGCPLAGSMRDGIPREVHVYMHHKTGYRMPVRVRSFPMRDETGKITAAVEVFSDDSAQRSLSSQVETLQQEAQTDSLTGIGNRRHANLTMEILQSEAREKGCAFGFIIVDIDNFKSINDTWGHGVGDQVLQTVAKTLTATLRPGDIACRWGGDEFVVLVPNASQQGLTLIGNRLVHLIKESWIDLGDEVLSYSASVGGALSRPSDSADDLLERADMQLYLSKENGRNCFHLNGTLS